MIFNRKRKGHRNSDPEKHCKKIFMGLQLNITWDYNLIFCGIKIESQVNVKEILSLWMFLLVLNRFCASFLFCVNAYAQN